MCRLGWLFLQLFREKAVMWSPRAVCSVGRRVSAVVFVSVSAGIRLLIDIAEKEEEADKCGALSTRGECDVFHFLYIC